MTSGTTVAQPLKTAVAPLIQSSCIHCHDAATETGLDFKSLGHDLSDDETYRKWQRGNLIYDLLRKTTVKRLVPTCRCGSSAACNRADLQTVKNEERFGTHLVD